MSSIKTLIELFDTCQVENAIAGLRFQPERIVFIGFKEIMTKRKMKSLEDFFHSRSENIEVSFEIVARYDFDSIVEKLNGIIDIYEDCAFDLTGGKEVVLAAMGAVSAVRNIPMFQINVRTGQISRIKNCDSIYETEKSVMTIDEAVALNNCSLLRNEKDDFSWEFTQEFIQDIESLWTICQKNFGLWNRQCAVLANCEKFGTIDGNLCVSVNLAHMKTCRQDIFFNKWTIQDLVNHHLITSYCVEDDVLRFQYKNRQVRQCIIKSGNVLELYCYLLLREIEAENPGYYDDMDIGVYIDWDGVVHENSSEVADTKNEIDIMVMRDLVPVFISCKNGGVDKTALYELDTVSRRFGGKYAKRVLIASYISSDLSSHKHIVQRAVDMQIDRVIDLEHMSREALKKALKDTVR